MTSRLSLGISPCPNDTFMFWHLVHESVFDVDLHFRDIEALNADAARHAFDVTKLSVPAAAANADHYGVLNAGAALGRGCGPLVVAREACALEELEGKSVAIPGERTTANLLLRIFGPGSLQTTALRFDQIMPAVAAGEYDAGLIIHESRFTYPAHGLAKVADLGELWEADTGLPIPLGLIAARRNLPRDVTHGLEQALRSSIGAAFDGPDRTWGFVREHSQEMSDDVCRQHIGLYVNEFSIDLGEEGRTAVDALLERGYGAKTDLWLHT